MNFQGMNLSKLASGKKLSKALGKLTSQDIQKRLNMLPKNLRPLANHINANIDLKNTSQKLSESGIISEILDKKTMRKIKNRAKKGLNNLDELIGINDISHNNVNNTNMPSDAMNSILSNADILSLAQDTSNNLLSKKDVILNKLNSSLFESELQSILNSEYEFNSDVVEYFKSNEVSRILYKTKEYCDNVESSYELFTCSMCNKSVLGCWTELDNLKTNLKWIQPQSAKDCLSDGDDKTRRNENIEERNKNQEEKKESDENDFNIKSKPVEELTETELVNEIKRLSSINNINNINNSNEANKLNNSNVKINPKGVENTLEKKEVDIIDFIEFERDFLYPGIRCKEKLRFFDRIGICVKIVSCAHRFHQLCFYSWLKQESEEKCQYFDCPTCKSQ